MNRGEVLSGKFPTNSFNFIEKIRYGSKTISNKEFIRKILLLRGELNVWNNWIYRQQKGCTNPVKRFAKTLL